MKKLALCLFLTLVFVISVSEKTVFSYAAEPERKKEVLISATFFDDRGKCLGTMRAQSKENKHFFILIPQRAEKFHLKINKDGNFFSLEEIEGTSPMIESSDFIGFIDLYDYKGRRFLFVSP